MKWDFNQKLEFSFGRREQIDLETIKSTINSCILVEKTDVETDKTGIDYIATLKGGAKIGIDAKAREKGASRYWNYGEAELALEIWSVCPTETMKGKKGWTLSDRSNVDYILYTFDFDDWDKFYLLPFQLLRNAFNKNGVKWCKQYKRKRQYSDSWQSEAVFVPASVVLSAISQEMIITKCA